VKYDVVIKIPFLAPCPTNAPTNFCISGLPTAVPFHLLACTYILSKPNLSSFITPSIPSSEVF
jgi:hypothetical protein